MHGDVIERLLFNLNPESKLIEIVYIDTDTDTTSCIVVGMPALLSLMSRDNIIGISITDHTTGYCIVRPGLDYRAFNAGMPIN